MRKPHITPGIIKRIKRMFAPSEDTNIASRNYAVGKYFIWKNRAARAKIAIATGDTLVADTNVVLINDGFVDDVGLKVISDPNGWTLFVTGNRYFGYRTNDIVINYAIHFGGCYYSTATIGKTPSSVSTIDWMTVHTVSQGGTMGGVTSGGVGLTPNTNYGGYVYSMDRAENFNTRFVSLCAGTI